MKKMASEIELYYSDVVAVEASIQDPECYQIYRIDVPQGQIVPLDISIHTSAREVTKYFGGYR